MSLTFGSLFAGIGGFDLGFERAGMVCKWQVEIDEYCRRVLAKHWPHVRRWDDVRTFPPEPADEWKVDVICGGFPCQDISAAGKKAGITGERSGLWTEYLRVLRILRPRFVVIENVADLVIRGLDRVLCHLAQIGYDAEWQTLGASEFGADHIRQRVFILAYPERKRRVQDQAETPIIGGHIPQEVDRPSREAWMPGFGRRIGRSGRPIPDAKFCRVDDGFPTELDRNRVKACGNAVVPQVAEWVGRRIVEVTND